MRPPHAIKPNKKGEQPYNLLFLDTETEVVGKTVDYEEISMKLWVSCYSRKRSPTGPYSHIWNDGRTPESLLELVNRRATTKHPLLIISSNIFFDVRVSGLLKNLVADDWKLGRTYVKGLTFIMHLRKGKRTIKLYNLQNWLPSSIKALGDMIGKPKLEIDFGSTDSATLLEYCKRDTEILRDSFITYLNFLSDNDLGNFQGTIASQSFTAYRHRFMDKPIFIHNNEDALKLERIGYFGGRCEAFFIGSLSSQKVYCYDVTSMYSYIMKTRELPYKLWFYSRKMAVSQLRFLLRNYCAMAEVELDTNFNIYPLHLDSKLKFPVGRFVTTLCSEALQFALDAGHIRKIRQVAIYHRAPIFKTWVDKLWSLRKDFIDSGNKPFTTMTKLIMNTLYGKFAQYSEEITSYPDNPDPKWGKEIIIDEETRRKTTMYQWGNKCFEVIDRKGESYNSFPAISAHITESARMHLFSMIHAARKENVLYCDTDSLFVTEAGSVNLKPFIQPAELGKLKLEKEGIDFTIRGCKDYMINETDTIKGIRKDAVVVAPNIYLQSRFPGFLSEVLRHLEGNYRIEYKKKTLKRIYDKGVVTQTGRVAPIRLEEI